MYDYLDSQFFGERQSNLNEITALGKEKGGGFYTAWIS